MVMKVISTMIVYIAALPAPTKPMSGGKIADFSIPPFNSLLAMKWLRVTATNSRLTHY